MAADRPAPSMPVDTPRALAVILLGALGLLIALRSGLGPTTA